MKIQKLHTYSLFLIATIGLLLISCSSSSEKQKTEAPKQEIMVFAAASLTDVLSEIVDSFEMHYPITVKLNLASSGTLARQITQDAAPDVYLSASKKWADYVEEQGYLKSGLRTDFAKNELVLITPKTSSLEISKIDSTLNFPDLLKGNRLSMGDPDHVPAGKYAKQALTYFGFYGALHQKTIHAKDVRSALMVVEMEEAPLGIVYRTDAIKSRKVKILAAFPEKSHSPIVYVAGVCSEKEAAKTFYQFLNNKVNDAIWLKYGFSK